MPVFKLERPITVYMPQSPGGPAEVVAAFAAALADRRAGKSWHASVELLPTHLKKVMIADLPADVDFRVTPRSGRTPEARAGLPALFVKKADGKLQALVRLDFRRDKWYRSIGMDSFVDLIRRAVEMRTRTHGDVTSPEYEGPFVAEPGGARQLRVPAAGEVPEWLLALRFAIMPQGADVSSAYANCVSTYDEICEPAEGLAAGIEEKIESACRRLSGWGSAKVDQLCDAVVTAKDANLKGVALEELMSRLFEGIKGFSVTSRTRTSTEELDLNILNRSKDPVWARESPMLLVECKNWCNKCGKNEYGAFLRKLENRRQRCSCGFLVSWNGFADTVVKEMLRGSRERILVVPVTGRNVRQAVQNGTFADILLGLWQKALAT